VIRLEVTFRAIFWLCFVGLTGLALSPGQYLPAIFNWWDKAQHAIGFGCLTVSALLAYPKAHKWKAAVLLCVHGCLIEVLQYFSGYRYGDWQDAAADAVGVALGMAVYILLTKLGLLTWQTGRVVRNGNNDTTI
jgi:VanZ family protein